MQSNRTVIIKKCTKRGKESRVTNTAVNMEKKYRIFISYRGESQGEGNTIGKKFAGKLYDYLISDPFFEEKCPVLFLGFSGTFCGGLPRGKFGFRP